MVGRTPSIYEDGGHEMPSRVVDRTLAIYGDSFTKTSGKWWVWYDSHAK